MVKLFTNILSTEFKLPVDLFIELPPLQKVMHCLNSINLILYSDVGKLNTTGIYALKAAKLRFTPSML